MVYYDGPATQPIMIDEGSDVTAPRVRFSDQPKRPERTSRGDTPDTSETPPDQGIPPSGLSLDDFIRYDGAPRRKRAKQGIVLPTIDGDRLYDLIATAEFLGVTEGAVGQNLYHRKTPGYPKPLGVDENGETVAAKLLSAHPELRTALEELLWRAGGQGSPLRLWRLSELVAYKATRRRGSK